MQAAIVPVFFSPTHSTRAVTLAIAEEMSSRLELPSTPVDITLPPARTKRHSFANNDVLVLGLPVYGGRIPLTVEAYLHSLKGKNTPAVLVAVYGNRHYDDALLEMADILRKQGFVILAAGAFIAQHTYTDKVGTGRPDEEDFAAARRFAQQAAANTAQTLQGSCLPEIVLPGSRPYRERKPAPPRGPVTDTSCNMCGICAQYCPTGAISLQNPKEADSTKCIACHACVKFCPQHSKRFADDTTVRIKAMLEENCTQPQSPALFC